MGWGSSLGWEDGKPIPEAWKRIVEQHTRRHTGEREQRKPLNVVQEAGRQEGFICDTQESSYFVNLILKILNKALLFFFSSCEREKGTLYG